MSRLGPQGVTLQAGARLAAQVIAGIGDTVSITRDTSPVFDTDTGAYTYTTTGIYTGYGRLRRAQVAESDVGAAGVPVATTSVHLPLGTTGVQVGDVVEFDGSRDPELLGRRFVVTDIPANSANTSLVLTVTELLVPAVVGNDVYVDTYVDVY